MQAVRPKAIVAPLQIGLGVQIHRQFGSRFLIDSLYRVSHKKGIDNNFIRSCSRPQFTVFEFIWIQYICKSCFVYHLKNLDASR